MANSHGDHVLQIDIIEHIGSGSYASVKKARYKNSVVAAKIFNRLTQSRDSEFLKEIKQLKRLQHPNIIRIIDHGKYKEKNDYFDTIIMEYADVGSLNEVLHTRKHLNYTLGHAISWLHQTACAVNYLHTSNAKPILHRDLKPLNLLLTNGGTLLKICDFGTTTDAHTQMTVEKGTPLYIAPEVLSEVTYSEKCDVYSYGIVLWEIFTRQKPYFDKPYLKSFHIMMQVKSGSLKPQPISNCPRILSLLYEQCVDVSHEKRPTMTQVFKIIEKINNIINKRQISPIIPQTLKSPISDYPSFISDNSSNSASTESLAQRNEKSPYQTVIRKPIFPQTQAKNEHYSNAFEYVNDDYTSKSSQLERDFKRLSFHNQTSLNLNNNKSGSDIYTNVENNNNNGDGNSVSQASAVKPGTHRRTRSYGYTNLDNLINSSGNHINEPIQNNVKNSKNNINDIEDIIDLNEPIEPVKDHAESQRLYREHKEKLTEHESLRKQIESLTHQKQQMVKLIKDQDLHQELLKQKQKLEIENSRLESEIRRFNS